MTTERRISPSTSTSTENAPPSPNIYQRLHAVMAGCSGIEKKGYNAYHKYHYVREADVLEHIRKLLIEQNLILLTRVEDCTKEASFTTLKIIYSFVAADTGERIEACWVGTGADTGDKGVYKAYTGALKYFLMRTFLIPSDADPEREDSPSANAPVEQVGGVVRTKCSMQGKTYVELVKNHADWVTDALTKHRHLMLAEDLRGLEEYAMSTYQKETEGA